MIAGSEEAGGAGRLSRRRLLSSAAAVAAAWAVDALRPAGAGAAAPGRSFVRSVINVKDYGAKGEGGDDTRALQRAIGASHAGDALYFPTGTYLVCEPLLPKPYQLFFGQTDRAILKAHPCKPSGSAAAFPIFVVRSGPVEFRRLTIDGSKDRMTAPSRSSDPCAANPPGICGRPGPGGMIVMSVLACRIHHAYGDGIQIAGDAGSGHRLQRVMVRDTVVEDCGLNGLAFGRINNIAVESCRFERCNNGIKMHGCQNAVVQGVTAQSNRRHGIAFTFSHRWRVEHCRASANGSRNRGWGILAGGEGKDLKDLVPNTDFAITDNVCVANLKGGISLDPTMPAESGEKEVIWSQRAKVSGNVCREANLGHGVHITHARDVLVTDNVCERNRLTGIELNDSAFVRVLKNTCRYNKIGIGEFVDGCVELPGHNLILNNRNSNNTWLDEQHKRTDTCNR